MSVHGAFDANADRLGDFEGVRQKLGLFLEAGFSAYRFQHVGRYGNDPQWSGLVQQDWFDVDPRYGTMEDFERLMAECAERDIAVIMMAVPEYVGWQHPLYLKARRAHDADPESREARWFEWHDDGTVMTCWDRPAPDCANSEYFDAFLQHIGFWMDKGIRGFDADAVATWHNADQQVVRRFTNVVKDRGGFVTAENFVLQDALLRGGGFNAGTGRLRHEFYNELGAIMEQSADPIRSGLKVREELIAHGMFPYQQFGDTTYATITGSWAAHRLEMFKLQVAFNAALPDQVWLAAEALTFTDAGRDRPELVFSVDWPALDAQLLDPDSAFSHVRRLFSLRAQHPELAVGHIHELETDAPECVFAAVRSSEDLSRMAVVVFNFSDTKRRVRLRLRDILARRFRNYLSGTTVEARGDWLEVDLQIYGYSLLEVLR